MNREQGLWFNYKDCVVHCVSGCIRKWYLLSAIDAVVGFCFAGNWGGAGAVGAVLGID